MLFSFGLIILLGLISNTLFEKMKLPGLLGMLLTGVIIGPYMLDWISVDVLNISGDLRRIALIVILLRAGMGINRKTLNKVGVTAMKMSCIPGIIEGVTIIVVSSYLLKISYVEAGMLAFIIAAVSPAVIVPQMLNLIEKRRGHEKGIPTLILAGASIDDVFAITIFSTFLGMYGGKNVNIVFQIFSVPGSIILGIMLGLICGIILLWFFRKYKIRDSKKILILLGISILLVTLEDVIKDKIPIASLLGVMTIGFIILEKNKNLAKRLAKKLNKVWVLAEILLFVLVGAQVNVSVALASGLVGLVIVFVGLIGRSIGVLISIVGTEFNKKEKLFCVFAYIPKATVQAAIGGVPLAMGVESGEVILAIAVLSIIITAPLGALLIKLSGETCLEDDSLESESLIQLEKSI